MHEYVKGLVTSAVGFDTYCLGVKEGVWDLFFWDSNATTMIAGSREAEANVLQIKQSV